MTAPPETSTHDRNIESKDAAKDASEKEQASFGNEDDYPPQSVVIVTMASMMLTAFLVSLVRYLSKRPSIICC